MPEANSNRLVLRADGNRSIGLGHIFRSLALADRLKDRWPTIFLIREPSASLKQLIEEVCQVCIALPIPANDFSEAEYLAENELRKGDLVVLDGYAFGTSYQGIIVDSGCTVICLDDLHAAPFRADMVINHSPGASAGDYRCLPSTMLCLGLDFALLRKPFLTKAATQNRRPSPDGVFICFGGVDAYNFTGKALRHLGTKGGFGAIHVVVGATYLFMDDLLALQSEFHRQSIYIHQGLSATDLIEVMERCRFAIVPASSILHEAICVGMQVLTGYYVDNQREVLSAYERLDMVRSIGDFHAFEAYDEELGAMRHEDLSQTVNRQRTVQSGQALIELPRAFVTLVRKLTLEVREASPEDEGLYFEWVNDPEVRKQSLRGEQVSWASHQTWFRQALDSSRHQLYVIERGGVPIGQVRFQERKGEAMISYSLVASQRGQGWSKPLLSLGLETYLKANSSIQTLSGLVKPSNLASLKTFRGLGFPTEEATRAFGQKVSKFTWNNWAS